MNEIRDATIDCFDEQVLREFGSGKLLDLTLEERVAKHLSSCGYCETRLEDLNDWNDPILEMLRIPSSALEIGIGSQAAATPSVDQSIESTVSRRAGQAESIVFGCPTPETQFENLPLQIDRYFIIRQLGKGGFGQVLLAKDPEHNRLVAVKIPRATYTGAKPQRDQFLREARTAAALDHPHIVPVYDCRELPDGRCIVVMKYVEGRTLRDLMTSERIGQHQCAEYVAMIAGALHFAHERGIWHRDVKPENVLLDSNNRPYLTDFGLAIHEDRQHLHENEYAGTYAYMSPEQVRGHSQYLDGRSDVWSLGVVLYEMLTRHRPFRGPSRAQFSDEIQNRAPKPPRQFDPTISRRLERVCLKCLAKDPADRFASAAELAKALRRHPSRVTRAASLAVLAVSLLLVAIVAAASSGLIDSVPRENNSTATVAKSIEIPLKPIAWSVLEPSDFYERSRTTGRIAIKSTASLSCFETHRPAFDHYRLSASADFQLDKGFAGLALGIHETSTTPPKYRCVIVYVSRDFPEPGTWLTIEDCDIGMNFFRHMDFGDRRHVANVKIDNQSYPSFQLDVEVNRERIVDIRYNARSLPEVTAELRELKIPPNTTCGIFANSHIVFHSLNCKELPQ